MTLTDLSPLQTITDANPVVDYFATIESAITWHPRSQQRRIGPSEMGTACTWCLAHKLAGIEEQRDAAWLPTIGTAMHTWLEDAFNDANRDKPARYLTEITVSIGDVGGIEITGKCDLFDTHTGWAFDHKIVGDPAIKNAKANGPSEQYRAQANLYGLGLANRGLEVREVAIAYLPRSAVSLAGAYVWHEPYDPAVAYAAIARCNTLHAALEAVGLDALRPALTRADGCWSCPRYPDPNGFAALPRSY